MTVPFKKQWEVEWEPHFMTDARFAGFTPAKKMTLR
jgi:hypothetical protein